MAAIRSFVNQMLKIAAEKRLWLCILGEIENDQMWLIRSRSSSDHNDPKILIVAGFHGEERAGPYAILKWLKECDSYLFRKIDLSFIPIVNPVGFRKNTRYSIPGEKTNCGFCHAEMREKPSREGQILMNNIDLIRPLAENGFLSLHEDATAKEYYIYTFEKSKTPSDFTYAMKNELGKYFRKSLDGVSVEIDASGTGAIVKNGIVYKYCDGSFDDWLFHLGVPYVAVSETPGLYKLKRRVAAGVAVINKFIELTGKK